MDFNIEVRKKQLQSLDQYITSSKDKVQSILDYLGWTAKKIIEKEPLVTCSINPSHAVTMKSANEHLKQCFIRTSGYRSDEVFLSEPNNDPSSSVKLDHSKKVEVLSKSRESNQKFRAAWNGQDSDPMTSDRLYTTYSTDERLTLYDYSVQNTIPPPRPSEFNIHIEEKKEEKFLTAEQILAKQRDAKRRRIKYKSVHTGRSKSHTEIIREVIENQMEQYKDYIVRKTHANQPEINNTDEVNEQSLSNNFIVDIKKENFSDMERPSSSFSRHSNHSGSSRHKKEYRRSEKPYKNHSYDDDYKKDYKENDRKYNRRSRYDHSSYKDSRKYKEFKDDYKRSRDKRDWHHKSDGRR